MANFLFLLPLILSLYLPIAFFTTYGIAVGLKHVYAKFPYISDTGTTPPESCIFGQLLNIYAVLAMFFMVIRYSQIREHYRATEELGGATLARQRKLLVNKLSLVVGLFAAFGASMVGNFQEGNVLTVHVIGAFMAFGCGGIYSWIQTVLSYFMPTLHGSTRWLRHTRILLCLLFTLFFFMMVSFTSISMRLFNGDVKNWNPGDPGYSEHLIATITEWLMTIMESLFFATFICEFRSIGLSAMVVQIRERGNDEQTLL